MTDLRRFTQASIFAVLLFPFAPVAGMASPPAGQGAPSFTLTKLNPFGGIGDVTPVTVNNRGQIAGWVNVSGSVEKGFLYQPSVKGAHARSYAVPVPKGESSADFNSINDGGDAAGYVCRDRDCHTYLPYAGHYIGSAITLTALKGLATRSKMAYGSAYQINAAGSITGFEVLADGKRLGVEWKNTGTSVKPHWSTPIQLAKPASFSYVEGTAIDNLGDVAGIGVSGKYTLATVSGPMGGVAVLPGFLGTKVAGVTQSFAQDLSSGNSSPTATGRRSVTVVGYSYISGSAQSPNYSPCFWVVSLKGGKVSKVSSATELGQAYDNPGNGVNGGANGINSHGWIAGETSDGLAYTPMVWTPSGQTYATYILQNLLPGFSPGFSLIQAFAINDKGQIVGIGNPSGPKTAPTREAVHSGPQAVQGPPSPHSWAGQAAVNGPNTSNCAPDCNQGFLLTPK